jgi:hypothetical protein
VCTACLITCWYNIIILVVKALKSNLPEKKWDRTYMWFDIFTVNQHLTEEVEKSFWFTAFE